MGDWPESAIRVGHKESNGPEGKRGDDGGSGNGEHPGPDDALSHAPSHSGKAAGGADADDGSGDGVGGADGDPVISEEKESDGAGAFGAESAHGPKLGDL